MKEFKLPPDFLMGSATSGFQIEGGDRNNSWYTWCEQPGRIKDSTSCFRAADHWNRYTEDIAIMKELHHDVYRMGVEWSRIEPEQGRFDQTAVDHYRHEIELLLRNGIKPLVTLHHFSNPNWLEQAGGWGNPLIVRHFTEYTRYVVNKLGDIVSDWVTINEPNVYLACGYAQGVWPPGKTDFTLLFKILRSMIEAHISSYHEIHKIRSERNFKGDTLVGVAFHLFLFEAKNGLLQNKLPTRLYRYLFQDLFIEGFGFGKMNVPLGFGGHPFGMGKYLDFLGVNYYTRNLVRFTWNPMNLFGDLLVKENVPVSDVGTEIYPEGIYHVCCSCYNKYKLPIFITENGLCDADDTRRTKFIYDHLQQIARLIGEGIPVKRYYHWSLLDNFELEQGESARYGLVDNDFTTQERTIRKSGWFYGEACWEKAVTQEMIRQYLYESAI